MVLLLWLLVNNLYILNRKACLLVGQDAMHKLRGGENAVKSGTKIDFNRMAD